MRDEHTILIDRPIAEVFAFVSNPANLSLWLVGVHGTEKVSPGPLGLGTIFRQEIGAEVIAYEPPHTFAWRNLAGRTSATMRFTCETESTRTRLSVAHDTGVPAPEIAALKALLEKVDGVEH